MPTFDIIVFKENDYATSRVILPGAICVDYNLRPGDAYGIPIRGVFLRETEKQCDHNVAISLGILEQSIYNFLAKTQFSSSQFDLILGDFQKKYKQLYRNGDYTKNTYQRLQSAIHSYKENPTEQIKQLKSRVIIFNKELQELKTLLTYKMGLDWDKPEQFIEKLSHYSKVKQSLFLLSLWQSHPKNLQIALSRSNTKATPLLQVFLESCNIQPDIGDSNEDSLLHLTHSYDSITLLLNHGYDINRTLKNYYGNTPLHMAIINEDIEWLQTLFKAADFSNTKIDFTVTDHYGNNALQLAVRINSPQIVHEVLTHIPAKIRKAIVNQVNPKTHQSPLHDAAMLANPEIVRMLLKYDADANAVDKNGNTALHKIVFTNQKIIEDKLAEVAIAGHRDIGATQNALVANQQHQSTPIPKVIVNRLGLTIVPMSCAKEIKISKIKQLILWNKDNINKLQKASPVFHKMSLEHPDHNIREMFQHAAKSTDLVIQYSLVKGPTIIQHAMNNRAKVVETLLNNKAQLLPNKKGKTALDYLAPPKNSPKFFQEIDPQKTKIKTLLSEAKVKAQTKIAAENGKSNCLVQ